MTLTKEQLDYLNSGGTLTNGQIPTKIAPTETSRGVFAIPVSTLTSTDKPIEVPPLPTPANLESTGTQATIDYFKEILAGYKPPESQADLFKQAQTDTGLKAKQQDVIAKQAAIKAAQSELQGIQAQLAGVTGRAQANVLGLEGQGRGIDQPILSRQAAEINRQAAIEAIPFQTQALVAQAKIASAQGDAELSQSILGQAQNNLNTLFKIKSDDATNLYNYRKNLIDKAKSHVNSGKNDYQKIDRIES